MSRPRASAVIHVGWGDVDPARIAFCARFFEWADSSLHQRMRRAGLAADELLTERRLAFGLVASGADFHSPARYGDELACASSIIRMGRSTFEVVHVMRRARSRIKVATVSETRICMDLSDPERLVAREIPADLRRRLKRLVRPRA